MPSPLSLRDIPPFGGNLSNGYLHYTKITKRLSARMVDIYAQELQKLSALCAAQDLSLTEVQNTHIRRWIAASHAKGLAPGTIALQLSSWRGFFKWLIQEGHSQHNPCLDVRAPKAAKPLPKALGVDAAVALAEFKSSTFQVPPDRGADAKHGGETAVEPSASFGTDRPSPLSALLTSPRSGGTYAQALDRLIVELLYGSGLRVSELVGLDIAASQDAINAGRGWIDADSGDVHVYGKGSKRRMVPLSSKAKMALSQYLPVRNAQLVSLGKATTPEAALLLSPKGVRLSRQAVWGLLKARSLAAGLDTPVHPHMLRHSFASHVLQSSGDLRAVQELLGHSSIASTQVYTRLDFQHLAKIYDNAHPRAKLQQATPVPPRTGGGCEARGEDGCCAN